MNERDLLLQLLQSLENLNNTLRHFIPHGRIDNKELTLTGADRVEVVFSPPAFIVTVDNDVAGGSDVYLSVNERGSKEVLIEDTQSDTLVYLVPCIDRIWVRCPSASGKVHVYWGY